MGEVWPCSLSFASYYHPQCTRKNNGSGIRFLGRLLRGTSVNRKPRQWIGASRKGAHRPVPDSVESYRKWVLLGGRVKVNQRTMIWCNKASLDELALGRFNDKRTKWLNTYLSALSRT